MEWITNNGKKIKVKDMSVRHIMNCLNMLNSHISYDEIYAGDYLYLPVESGGDTIISQNLTVEEWIEIFENELSRRKDIR